MSTSTPIPRPPSRSERLLRDTLRRDDTLRTHGVHSSRPRSIASSCDDDDDDDDDDDFFQSAILLRCSSRRNSAASALGHAHSKGFYVPDENEHASYSRVLRSSSYSGSSRSGRSDRNASPRPTRTRERQEQPLCVHDPPPHDAVLRNRLESIMHNMWIDNDKDAVDPPTASPSSLSSISNSQAHSHESHQTHLTIPDSDPCARLSSRQSFPRGHRYTQSASVVPTQPTSRQRTSPPHVASHSLQGPRTQFGMSSLPQTPTSQEKEQLKRLHPDSPWVYTRLPPSPPSLSAEPSKRGGSAVVTFVTSSPMIDTRAHLSTHSPAWHSPNSSPAFDPEAASHALRQLPGYVSFASVAGLGAPPEEEDRRGTRRSFPGLTLGGGKGRLPSLSLGSGKWWAF